MESNVEGFSWSRRRDPLGGYEQWVRIGALDASAFRVAISEQFLGGVQIARELNVVLQWW